MQRARSERNFPRDVLETTFPICRVVWKFRYGKNGIPLHRVLRNLENARQPVEVKTSEIDRQTWLSTREYNVDTQRRYNVRRVQVHFLGTSETGLPVWLPLLCNHNDAGITRIQLTQCLDYKERKFSSLTECVHSDAFQLRWRCSNHSAPTLIFVFIYLYANVFL